MKFIIKICLAVNLLLILAVGSALSADKPNQSEELPIGFTAEELTRLNEIGINHIATAPPPSGNIRCPAEWEPSEGVVIRYPLGISYDIVRELAEDLIVYCLVSSSYQSSAYNNFSNNGVNMSHVQFITAYTDSYWTRDYGPWFIFDGNGDFGIVDPIYNRPRPNDDAAPGVIGSAWGVPVYGLDIETPGGNHMSNGLGTSISTDLVYTENPGLSHHEIDSMITAFLGNDYVVVDDALGEYIEHIDCWAKFISPQKIMVLELPASNPQSDNLDDAANYFASLIGPWGRPYEVVRIYSPGGDQAYTNSVILNKKVFVPISGSTYYDNQALETYETAMPGYEVLGFTGSWYNTDALHCRTMGVPDPEMLFIDHIPLFVSGSDSTDYEVSAKIVDHSETGLISDSLKIYYSTDGGIRFSSTMMSGTAVPDSFVGYIPEQDYGTDIYYYLKAADNSGRVETHPYIGALGAHHFHINMPPQITSDDSLICKTSAEFAFCPEYSDGDNTDLTLTYDNYPGWMSVDGDTLRGIAPEEKAQTSFEIQVSDPYVTTSQTVQLQLYLCGDVVDDGTVDLLDILFMIEYKFKDGPAPAIMEAANVDNIGGVDLLDILYLIDYKFKDGPEPICP